MKNKIYPGLWFSVDGGDIKKVVAYYKKIFKDDLKVGEIKSLKDTPGGRNDFVEISIFGQKYFFMNTEKGFDNSFNYGVSLIISCDDQKEINKFWNYFTKEGKAFDCGWCMDKYGFKWQITPKNMDKLLKKPDAWNVMMKQQKIIIAEYLKNK